MQQIEFERRTSVPTICRGKQSPLAPQELTTTWDLTGAVKWVTVLAKKEC